MTLRNRVGNVFLAALACASIAFGQASNCEALASQSTADTVIHAETVSAGTFKLPDGKARTDLPAFCRVRVLLTPSRDSAINVELWLPASDWNGKLQGVGNGGYAGSIGYDGLAEALRLHYATVGTDTGHQGSAEDATWALNHPEKITDFGYRAIHLMTAKSKLLIQAFYGVAAKHAYFNACSNGGREALMEAQRFPGDYDGIIAGAPANYWTHLLSNAVANLLALLNTKESYIQPAKLPAIQAAAQQACDLNDGVKDNVIENPARCRFDTSVLLCKGTELDSCLTAPQVAALNQLYAGKHFFPGYVPGGEAAKGNWDAWITGSVPGNSNMFAYGTQFFKNMVYNSPGWDFHGFQADRDVKAADDKFARTLNSTDPDLSAFTARGGKLILYHGWDDAAISPLNSINYFEAVQKKMGALQTTKSIRLFMVPGMQHCFGGNGAFSFGQLGAGAGDAEHDIDSALVNWVENGKAPERIVASKPDSSMTHPLCAFPKVAGYDRAGDVGSARSYACVAYRGGK